MSAPEVISRGPHHVEIYRDEIDGSWGAQCFTCTFDRGGYSSFAVAEQVGAEHEEATQKGS